MATLDVDSSNFEEVVLAEGIVLVDCWAKWCHACKDFEPVFKAAAERHPDHVFVKIDAQSERELIDKLSVSHIPTLILFRDGILLLRQPGYMPGEGLDEVVAQAESLDMDHVLAEMDKDEVESS